MTALPPTERDGPPSWAAVGRYLVHLELWNRREDVAEASHELEQAIREGRAPTAEQVAAARRAIERHQEFLEEYVVPFVQDEDVEPWGQRPRGVPFGRLKEWADRSE